MLCPSCGRNNRERARFCHSCGRAISELLAPPTPIIPTSFAAGRYQVQRFLSEGGRKRVYLVCETRLDRDVTIAMTKTEGLHAAGHARPPKERA